MDTALTLPSYAMPNTKESKKEVMERIKNKLENAKLNLIYTELEEAGISVDRNYNNVKELVKDCKGKFNTLDYNKLEEITDKVNNSLETMVGDLEKGSTNAFTKFMTSPMAKTVAKSLGISLAGRAALILAPTLATKALVGVGLAGYSLYRVIKNRKEIKEANEENELNNILMDLETTKSNDKYTDTRFSEETQEKIRAFLKEKDIKFEDTGYRSLRACIYGLDKTKKRALCELLNKELGKGINIEERVSKAKKKLNMISTTAAAISSGAALGAGAATAINAIDPALVAGPINGTVLGVWIQQKFGKGWLSGLVGGLGAVGSEVLQHIPLIGTAVTKFEALETFAALGTIGAVGGAVVAAGTGIASIIKRIFTNKKNKKETQEFLDMDATKYRAEDKKELNVIKENLNKQPNELEACVVDVVVGSLREDGIEINSNPTDVNDLRAIIEDLPAKDKAKASSLLNNISYNIDNDPNFIKDLKKAGKVSVGLFTAGLAAMSVYDIVKGGTFLPELSKKLFPKNNIHAPVEVPPALTEKLDPSKDAGIINKNTQIYEKFDGSEYKTEFTGDYQTAYGANYMQNNPGLKGTFYGTANVNAGIEYNFANNVADKIGLTWLLNKLGVGNSGPQEVINIPKISDALNEMSPQELYNFYRTFNTIENDGSELYRTVNEVLSYKSLTDKATTVIENAAQLQEFNDIVNKVTNVAAGISVPVGVGVETIDQIQKEKTTEMFDNKDLIEAARRK